MKSNLNKRPTWRAFNEKLPSFASHLSHVIAQREISGLTTFPDLRTDNSLFLLSDYSGDAQSSGYHIFTYLLTDPPGIWEWNDNRSLIREKHLPDQRRISFKSLNDGKRRRALLPFLQAANSIDGVLFSIAIHCSTPKFLNLAEQSHILEKHCTGNWKEIELEKMVRVTEFSTMLIASLCAPYQEIHWITDEDGIVVNETFQLDTYNHAKWKLSDRCPGPIGTFKIGIAGKFQDERMAEDLVAITDLFTGALVEFLPGYLEKLDQGGGTYLPIEKGLSVKSHLIMPFLSQPNTRLKKILCILKGNSNNEIGYHFPDWKFSIEKAQNPSPYNGVEKWGPAIKKWVATSG